MTRPVVVQPDVDDARSPRIPNEPSGLTATYTITCPANEVQRVAEGVALEQTVEVPDHFIRDPQIRETVLGRVLKITPVAVPVGSPEQFEVRIEFPAELVAGSLSQLLNLVYGNISLKRQLRLTNLDWPASVLKSWPGPKFGAQGLREMTGVHGRPLLATALKPRGSAPETLAQLAGQFAAGGGDLVKDDHNLVEASVDEFRERVELCHAAVLGGRQASGANTVYFPNLTGTPRELARRAEFLVTLGIRGVLVAPSILGLDVIRELSEEFPLALLAHPTFSGALFHDPLHGVEPELMLGTLYRLAGCDGIIFPNHGGRFTFDLAECRRIADAAMAALGPIHPAMPAPAGGMSFETIPAMSRQYGSDAMFLIGGALLADSQDLTRSTARFLKSIENHFPEGKRGGASEAVSACEISGSTPAGQLLEHIRFGAEFRWEGRPEAAYKMSAELPFRDVRRVELIGSTGERTAFDLRYFEIGPGGYTSFERHQHTHVVISIRGTGELQTGDRVHSLQPFDVGYVDSMVPHQIRNPGNEPFGFFCIVDHQRDKPIAP